MRVNVLIACAILLVGTGSKQSFAEDLDVELLPASRQVQIADPLLLKIVVTNNSRVPVKLPAKIGTSEGTLRIEVRGPGQPDFLPLLSRSGAVGGVRPGETIWPRTTVTSCEAMFKRNTAKFVFEDVGTYFIRVRVVSRAAAVASSPAVRIEVVERGDRKTAEQVERLKSTFFHGLDPMSSPLTRELKLYEAPARELGDSEFKSLVLSMAAIARLRDARGDELGVARDAFDSMRERADPATKDWMTLSLAAVYAYSKEYQAAIAELDAIMENNTQKARLIRQISESQREAFEKQQHRQKQENVTN